MRADLKNTVHYYKGFSIHGKQRNTSGGYVLGGRHFVEGGIARNYVIKYQNAPIFKYCIIEKLRDAKEEIDLYIERKQSKF